MAKKGKRYDKKAKATLGPSELTHAITREPKYNAVLCDECTPCAWVPLQFNEVAKHRELACPHYENCLSYAAKQRWIGWTCLFCKQHRKEIAR